MENELQKKSVDERLEDCLTLSDIHDSFTLRELVILTQDRVLEKWMKTHLLESQAEILSNVRSLNGDAVLLALCEILDLDITKLSDYEAGLVIRAVRHKWAKNKRERECGKDSIIVTNQGELVEALTDENVHKVYLYNGIFSIPLSRGNITYDGRDNAIVNISAQGNTILDFDGNKVYFYNLTIVFNFLEPQQVKINHSAQNNNHIIFMRYDRIVQDNSVLPHEMAAFLAGRTPFESAHDFAERAKKFHNVIVGKTYLNDTDYDLWHEAFFLNPAWRVEFIECLRRYVRGAKLVFHISCTEAKELFERERAQLIYADFSTDRNDAVIIRLYLHTENGQGKIYPIHRLWSTTSWAFGSGSGEGGYGLDLIDVE